MQDADLLDTARDFRDGLLGAGSSRRMCFLVCTALRAYLAFIGVEASLADLEWREGNHYWLVLADGRVLDPTVDQFSNADTTYPTVYLGPPLPLHRSARSLQRAARLADDSWFREERCIT